MFNELFLPDERIEVNEMIDLLDAKLIRANIEYKKCHVESYNAATWRKYIHRLTEAKINLMRIVN
jgi:hypothetical protein